MLRTNLATRPFYNERLVHLALAVVAVLVLAGTAVNIARVIELSRRQTELALEAAADEQAADETSRRAAALRRQVNSEELEQVAGAAREANQLIDRRTFSWTALFNQIEETLPGEVMMTSVQPEIEQDRLLVSMVVIARRVEDIEQFIEALEGTGAFADLLVRQEEVTDEGMYRAILRGRYLGAAAEAAGGRPVGVLPAQRPSRGAGRSPA